MALSAKMNFPVFFFFLLFFFQGFLKPINLPSMYDDMLCPTTYLPYRYHASTEPSAVVSLQLTYPVILSNGF